MDVEELIAEVLKHECLWNQAHVDHHNRYILDKKWEQVCFALNHPKETIKNKWKYLRDAFRKELAKVSKPKSGDAGGIERESKWLYYKSLLFLKSQFTPRSSTSNLAKAKEDQNYFINNSEEVEEYIEVDEENWVNESSIVSEEAYGHDKASQEITTKKAPPHTGPTFVSTPNRKRKRQGTTDSLVSIEKEKLKLLKEKHDRQTALDARATQPARMDDDEHYLLSLLPFVKKVDFENKLSFRNEINNVIARYIFCPSRSCDVEVDSD